MKQQQATCRKKTYQKFSFDLKLSVIDQCFGISKQAYYQREPFKDKN